MRSAAAIALDHLAYVCRVLDVARESGRAADAAVLVALGRPASGLDGFRRGAGSPPGAYRPAAMPVWVTPETYPRRHEAARARGRLRARGLRPRRARPGVSSDRASAG